MLAKTLKNAIHVDDGAAYLEKIVQVSFRIPRPEAFDLRRWFESEVYSLFAEELEELPNTRQDIRQRLAHVIDIQGGRYLQKARDVKRVLDALRLYGIPVRKNVDIADVVWLQLARVGNTDLYNWVEEYVRDASAVINGARVTEAQSKVMAERIESIFAAEKLDVTRAMMDLADILPGIDRSPLYQSEGHRSVFNNLHRDAVKSFVTTRRLGSPQHYRFYFAFAEPAGALRDEELNTFIQLADEQADNATSLFDAFARTIRPQGGVMAEVLIDRLISGADRIPTTAVPNIFRAFGARLDDVALSSREGDFGNHRAWPAASKAVHLLLNRLPAEDRKGALDILFTSPSLGWLTSIIRNEIFAHGHYGDRPEPESEWLLSADEFEHYLKLMLQRYAETSPNQVLEVPNFMGLLYAWQQGGNAEDAKQWVAAQISDDTGLLAFLSRARGWAASSNIGVYYPLRKADLERFLDYEDAINRLRQISLNPAASDQDRHIASELLVAVEQDRDS